MVLEALSSRARFICTTVVQIGVAMRTEETTGNVFDEFSLLDRYMVHDYRYTGRGMRTPTGGEGHRQVGAGSNIRTKLLDAIRWRFGRFPSPEAFPLTGLETRKNYG